MRFSLVAPSTAFLLAACASSKPSGPEPVEVYSTGVPGEAAATSFHKMTATVLKLTPGDRLLATYVETVAITLDKKAKP